MEESKSDEHDGPTTPHLIAGGGGTDMLIKEEPHSPTVSDIEEDQFVEQFKRGNNGCFGTLDKEIKQEAQLRGHQNENLIKDDYLDVKPFKCSTTSFSKTHSVAIVTPTINENPTFPTNDNIKSENHMTQQPIIAQSSNLAAVKVVPKFNLRGRNPFKYSTIDAKDDIKQQPIPTEEKQRKRSKFINKVLKCRKCKKLFKTKSHLKQHKRLAHGKVYYSCTKCGWKSDDASLYECHMKIHHHPDNETDLQTEIPKQFTCKFCKKDFEDKNKLRAHISIRHKDTRNKFKCMYCDKEYMGVPAYRSHLASEHDVKEFGRVKCAFIGCGKLFYHDRFLSFHEKRHPPGFWECDTCELKIYSHLALRKHKRKEHQQPNSEMKPQNRPKGARKADDLLEIRCSGCDLYFPNKLESQNHWKEIHEKSKERKDEEPIIGQEEEAVICQSCGAIFSSKASLQSHIEENHWDWRKFQVSCELCGKIFVSNVNLRLHIQRVHECQRNVQCHICGFKLFGQSDLKKHVNTIHTNRDTKPFACVECGKQFASKDYLRKHLKIHVRMKTSDEPAKL